MQGGKNTEELYDAAAKVYDAKLDSGFISARIRKYLRAKVISENPEGSNLLDIGCGTGAEAIYFAERGFNISGIDISQGMLNEAELKVNTKNLRDKVKLQKLNAEDLSVFGDNSFDGAYSNFNVVNHMENPVMFINELYRVLKPGGKFFTVMLGKRCPSEAGAYVLRLNFSKAFKKLVNRTYDFPAHIKLYTPVEIKKMFEDKFKASGIKGFGLLLPPDQFYKKGKLSGIFSLFGALEKSFNAIYPFYNFCDHIIIEFRKI